MEHIKTYDEILGQLRATNPNTTDRDLIARAKAEYSSSTNLAQPAPVTTQTGWIFADRSDAHSGNRELHKMLAAYEGLGIALGELFRDGQSFGSLAGTLIRLEAGIAQANGAVDSITLTPAQQATAQINAASGTHSPEAYLDKSGSALALVFTGALIEASRSPELLGTLTNIVNRSQLVPSEYRTPAQKLIMDLGIDQDKTTGRLTDTSNQYARDSWGKTADIFSPLANNLGRLVAKQAAKHL